MKKICDFCNLIFKNKEKSIYRRILRNALFASGVTFITMSIISLCGMFILQKVMTDRGRVLSEDVGDYLEHTVEGELKTHLTETISLKAEFAGRLLKSTSVNTEFLAGKVTEILKNKTDHVKKIAHSEF